MSSHNQTDYNTKMKQVTAACLRVTV